MYLWAGQFLSGLYVFGDELKIDKLVDLAREMPAYRRLIQRLEKENASVTITEGAKPFLLAGIYRDLKRPVVVITAQPEKSRRLGEQIAAWCDLPNILQLPEPDGLPYARLSPDLAGELDRLRVLSHLSRPSMDAAPLLVIASVPALLQKLPSSQAFRTGWVTLRKGMKIDPLNLASRLNNLGYHTESLVEVPGGVSRRGGIVDVYPPTSEMPVRIEFFGNNIDSLRLFEPVSQRSLKPVESIELGPASEMSPYFIGDSLKRKRILESFDLSKLNDETRTSFERDFDLFRDGHMPETSSFYAALFNEDTFLSYLPPGCLVVLDEPGRIKEESHFLDDEARPIFEQRLGSGELPSNFPRPYFTWEEIETGLVRSKHLEFSDWAPAGESEAVKLDFVQAHSYAGQLPAWIDKVKRLALDGKRIVAVSQQAGRLAELLEKEGISAAAVDEVDSVPQKGSLTLVQGLLAQGWEMGGNVFLFTDSELFGFLKQQRSARRRPVAHHKLYVDIKPGDYVVHIEHGIGKFSGVITMNAGGLTREYMLLDYAAGDRLYVPTDQIDRVGRYIGAGDHPPTLSRLGSLEWVRSKDRARASAEDIAEELLNIYAAREVAPGFAYSPDNNWQMELEASFPYVETPDQLTAIAQIKEDMSHARPMDRLVCGDVGYGKTEVAVRAAFKAVMDDKQVAILVPTTVLAQQHYATFKERLSAFPVRVESLSRFKSAGEQKEVIAGIADGSVDIAIGTHRLIQKDVIFKDLGLLIIDEEQRFGVSHKEHFKQMRQEVDVLTLSATPIPRTLNLSLVGVRDMSVMETPPEERLPIKTYMAEYDDQLVREAIVREIERNGQVFFVHNRVQSIGILAEKLKVLVPEARIAVGHGQMHEDELERVMGEFAQGNVDVLLCTTIIESGLDVPNANTLIISQADRLGLTQLYQLRGRVGRGANLAYAYFLYDKNKRLTPDADQRLRTIYEATELGAGFGIAMKDLEIRGAGNILGVRQSGHINSVGFSLYTQLLAEAVDELKARRSAEKQGKSFVPRMHLPPPTIDLPQPAFIPGDYVADTDTRLSLYQCLAGAKNIEGVEALGKDFKDRFGELPVEVRNLLFAVKLKVLAARARIESISTEGEQIVLRRPSGIQFDPARTGASRTGVRASINQVRLDTTILGKDWQKDLEEVVTGLGAGLDRVGG
jgi:transcription-repair coupling factor (superfamily II helicase)